MKRFPDSPLVHGAMLRIARMHGGDLPKEAEAVWKRAKAITASRENERLRAFSMCGPEVVAEVLRRAGQFQVSGFEFQESACGSGAHSSGQQPARAERSNRPVTSDSKLETRNLKLLADELHTTHRGTTLLSIAKALRRRGFAATGFRLDYEGLRTKLAGKAPAATIALVTPGHYVLVEDVAPFGVRYWDPEQGVRNVSPEAWEQLWGGVALVVEGGG